MYALVFRNFGRFIAYAVPQSKKWLRHKDTILGVFATKEEAEKALDDYMHSGMVALSGFWDLEVRKMKDRRIR